MVNSMFLVLTGLEVVSLKVWACPPPAVSAVAPAPSSDAPPLPSLWPPCPRVSRLQIWRQTGSGWPEETSLRSAPPLSGRCGVSGSVWVSEEELEKINC